MSVSNLMAQNPLALTALALLAVPIAIHLLSKGRITQVKFANINLLRVVKPKKMRHIMLTEPFLLLLRLLLLTVSILMLAQVFYLNSMIVADKITLVTAQWLNNSNDTEKQALLTKSVDSPIYMLSRDSVKLSKDEVLNWQKQQAQNSPKETHITQNKFQDISLNLYYFLQKVKNGATINIFTSDKAINFSSVAIEQKYNVHWHTKNITKPADINSKMSQNILIVYDQDRAADIKYFQQALSAISRLSDHKFSQLSFLNNNLTDNQQYQNSLAKRPTWIFYFSSIKPDESIMQAVKNGSYIFVDAKLAHENLMSLAMISLDKDNNKFLPANITFYQRARPLNILESLLNGSENIVTQALWQYQESQLVNSPMLTKSTISWRAAHDELASETDVYQFYSRFSPSWSTLLASTHFPVFLQNLLLADSQRQVLAQQYRLSEKIINLQIGHGNLGLNENKLTYDLAEETPPESHQIADFANLAFNVGQQQRASTHFTQLLAILLILLWLLERVVSEALLKNSQQFKQVDNIATVSHEQVN